MIAKATLAILIDDDLDFSGILSHFLNLYLGISSKISIHKPVNARMQKFYDREFSFHLMKDTIYIVATKLLLQSGQQQTQALNQM